MISLQSVTRNCTEPQTLLLGYHSPSKLWPRFLTGDFRMQAIPTQRTIRHAVTVVCLLLTTVAATAQFVGSDAAATDKRVNDIVAKMTLDEKIEILGGDTPFRTHAIPRLGSPTPQALDWLHPGIAHLPCAFATSLAGILAPGALHLSSAPASIST